MQANGFQFTQQNSMVNGVKCFTKVQENRGSNQTVISIFKNVVEKAVLVDSYRSETKLIRS
jgi:hypothetical protein